MDGTNNFFSANRRIFFKTQVSDSQASLDLISNRRQRIVKFQRQNQPQFAPTLVNRRKRISRVYALLPLRSSARYLKRAILIHYGRKRLQQDHGVFDQRPALHILAVQGHSRIVT
jgi:hypothetical protein